LLYPFIAITIPVPISIRPIIVAIGGIGISKNIMPNKIRIMGDSLMSQQFG